MEHLTFDPELWSLIPSHFAREYRILPFGWEDDGVALVLLLDDESHETPEDCLAAQETIRFMLDHRDEPCDGEQLPPEVVL